MRGKRLAYRLILLISLACLLLTALPACSPGGENLALTICIESNLYNKLETVLSRYAELYPDITVTYEILPNALSIGRSGTIYDLDGVEYDAELRQQMVERLRSETMSGNGPDLFVLNTGATYEGFFQDAEKAMRNGVFCDLLPLFEAEGISETDFVGPVMDAGKVGGKQYVAPLDYQVLSVVTSEASRKMMGDSAFANSASLLSRLRDLIESPDFVNKLVFDNYGSNHFADISPYYLTDAPLVNYDTQEIQVDTPLTREIMQTVKLVTDQITDRVPFKDFKETIGVYTWQDYILSDDYFMLSPMFVGICQEMELIDYLGYTPDIDRFPTESGGACAIVHSYAGIRANSRNKQAAIKMIGLMLGEEAQSRPKEYATGTYYNGWSVRKGLTPIRIYGLIRKKAPINCIDFVRKVMGASPDEIFSGMKQENIKKINDIEDQITTARFPVPRDVRDILDAYYTGSLELDEAIVQMQQYWEWTVFE